MAPLPDGILLIDKPKGITSFDVIRRLRHRHGVRRMGHAGTLDPLASGLMIVAEGQATKLLNNYLKLDKVYEAEVMLGERSTTADAEGEVVEQAAVPAVDEQVLRETAASMVGTLELPVPAYSAVKRGGEPLYKKARRGESVETPVRPMHVYAAEYLSSRRDGDRLIVSVHFHVGSGTYIRSLAEEYGKRLGYPARLENLRRTQVGEFNLEDASPLPEPFRSDQV
jgi:tRNA pseudouridine55 synthase